MRISDWSSDVCSSDLLGGRQAAVHVDERHRRCEEYAERCGFGADFPADCFFHQLAPAMFLQPIRLMGGAGLDGNFDRGDALIKGRARERLGSGLRNANLGELVRSEEHTSELQSLMRISYAVFCLK